MISKVIYVPEKKVIYETQKDRISIFYNILKIPSFTRIIFLSENNSIKIILQSV